MLTAGRTSASLRAAGSNGELTTADSRGILTAELRGARLTAGGAPVTDPPADTAGLLLLKRPAAAALSGQRPVVPDSSGAVHLADPSSAVDVPLHAWLTVGAVDAGATAVLLVFGGFVEPSWSWIPGAPVYLGLGGVLTQTPPTLAAGYAYSQHLGAADTPHVPVLVTPTPVLLA